MLYTIIGGIAGMLFTLFACKMFNVSMKSSHFLPSPGEVMVGLGMFVGAGVGFGFGSGQLMAGTHLYNYLFS